MKIVNRHGLWVVLALALAVRLSPMLFEFQAGRDISEYASIAENIRAGRGFLSDIKVFWLAPARDAGAVDGRFPLMKSPRVIHNGFPDRPLLLPLLLAVLRLGLSPLAAGQVAGPLLYLGALALIWATLRRQVGPSAAFSAGVLLALNPALLELSLMPLSENTVLFALALIVWAHFSSRSALLTGMACSLAFLARPSTALFAVVLGLIYLAEAVRTGQVLRLAKFAVCAAVGPLWVMAFNRHMGLPPTTLPQAFLFKVRTYEDGMSLFHHGVLYSSALELIRANGREVARKVAMNGLYYLKALGGSEGLGMLVALIPVAAAGLSQAQSRPLRRFRLLALFIALDLGLYVAAWSTFDSVRFLSVSIFLALPLLAIGCHEVLDREPLFRGRGAWRSAATWGALAIGLAWLAQDAGTGYVALREWQSGHPLTNNLDAAWSAPGVEDMLKQLVAVRGGQTDPAQLQVVASNDPWLVNRRTRMPAGMIPYDLKGQEWIDFLKAMEADLVVLHQGEWPEAQVANLDDLEHQLIQAGWTEWYAKGVMTAWLRPVKAGAAGGGK